MIRRRPKARSVRRPGTGAALMRAMLLVGPIALALAFGVSPKDGRQDYFVMLNGGDGVDTMTTASISSSHYALGRPSAPTGNAPCLKFPDGTQRGAC